MPTAGLPDLAIPALGGVSIPDAIRYDIEHGDTPRVQAWDFLLKTAQLYQNMQDSEMQTGVKLLLYAQHERELQTEFEHNQQGFDVVRKFIQAKFGYDVGEKGYYEAAKTVGGWEVDLDQQKQANYRSGLAHGDAQEAEYLDLVKKSDPILGAQMAALDPDAAAELLVQHLGNFQSYDQVGNTVQYAAKSRFAATGIKDGTQYMRDVLQMMPPGLAQMMPGEIPLSVKDAELRVDMTDAFLDKNRTDDAAVTEQLNELTAPRGGADDWQRKVYEDRKRALELKQKTLESAYWGWIKKNPLDVGTREQYKIDYAKSFGDELKTVKTGFFHQGEKTVRVRAVKGSKLVVRAKYNAAIAAKDKELGEGKGRAAIDAWIEANGYTVAP